jgi:hypothetical protein
LVTRGPPPFLSVGLEEGTELGEVVGPLVVPADGRELGTEFGFALGETVGSVVCPSDGLNEGLDVDAMTGASVRP